MVGMPSPESDLVIVSLVRFADSCEPSRRHRDCPFAVERQGEITCAEECRGVIKSLLRRGRSEPASSSQSFDARQLRLSEPPGAPDILWHTSSLMQVVVEGARSNPFRSDGSFNLRRIVDVTSALGALGGRGLDPEQIVRRGVAASVKLQLAVSLARGSGSRLDGWEHLAEWQNIFKRGVTGEPSVEGYVKAVLEGPVAQYLNAWIAMTPIEDVLTWKPPGPGVEPQAIEPSSEDVEIWTWLIDRFTKTYLDRWSPSSLKREYSLVKGSWQPDVSTEILAERVVTREEVATALADRAISRDEDGIDPGLMNSFVAQAIALLHDGQRTAAAALFNAARMLNPKDLAAQNNYAFCILIDKPDEAKRLFEDVLGRREPDAADSAVTWCNLALAESLLGDNDAALQACERAYGLNSEFEAFLWVSSSGDWIAQRTTPGAWAAKFGAGLERSAEVCGDLWAKRLESLASLNRQSTSSNPSSAETDGVDL